MKIRTGFISNSSSSSFVIYVPKDSTVEDILLIMERQVGSMQGFFIPDFRERFVNTLVRCIGSKVDLQGEMEAGQKYIDDGSKWASKEDVAWCKDKIDRNLDVYRGGFDDQGDDMERWLCDESFEIEDEDFFMTNTGGY